MAKNLGKGEYVRQRDALHCEPTLSRSNGWVQAAAIAEAMPPRYHLCFLAVTLTVSDAGLVPSFNLVDILHG